jgi:hypothetical protein
VREETGTVFLDCLWCLLPSGEKVRMRGKNTAREDNWPHTLILSPRGEETVSSLHPVKGDSPSRPRGEGQEEGKREEFLASKEKLIWT